MNDKTVYDIINDANQNDTNKYYSDLTETSIKTKQGNEIMFSDLYAKTTPSFNPETLTIGSAINTNKYGWKVTNYNVEETETGAWRLFFQDSNYTYLISDNCVGNYMLSSDYYSSYTNGSFVSTVGQKLNPMLLNAGTFFVEGNTSANIRATAWLTDPEVWRDYKNDDAVFAIRESNTRTICSII